MLDEKLSCLLDESEDELDIKNEKNVRNEKYKNTSSSIWNFNISNIENLDVFFKNSNEKKNSKHSKTDIKNSNLNENTPFHNVTNKNEENGSDSIHKTTYICDNDKNNMNIELKEKHAQLKVNSNRNLLNTTNVKYNEISKYPDDSCTYFSLNEKIIKNNFENNSQNESILPNTLKNFHNDNINSSCKLNERHEELNYIKKDLFLQEKKSSYFKEKNYSEKNKEEMANNVNLKGNSFSETNLYKEHFKISEIKENRTSEDRYVSNKRIRNYNNQSSESTNTYLSNQNSILIGSNNNESNCNIENNELLNEVSPNYSHFNLNEIPFTNNKSYSSFNGSELIINQRYQKNISILNSNSTKSNSLLGPAGLKHKTKKYGNKKSKELIYCFSFIKYKSWIKALQLLNLPLNPFHLSINSHKYICDHLFNKSFLYQYNIHNILNNKNFSNYRIERMMVIVKSIICRSHGYFLVVMDPTGQMPASLHKEVEIEYKKNIDIGCTLLLRNVTVFDTIDNFPYLIITLRSLVRVLKSEEADLFTKEKIFNQLYS